MKKRGEKQFKVLFQVRRGNYFNQLMNGFRGPSAIAKSPHSALVRKMLRIFHILDQEQSMVEY